MRIGIKPGQIGLAARELPEYWRAAEAAGFESVWTFGASEAVRALAREHGLAWNYSGGSDGSADEFRRLAEGQPDPQAQVFLSQTPDLAAEIDRYAEAGATRLVIVLTPPMARSDIDKVARIAGLG